MVFTPKWECRTCGVEMYDDVWTIMGANGDLHYLCPGCYVDYLEIMEVVDEYLEEEE